MAKEIKYGSDARAALGALEDVKQSQSALLPSLNLSTSQNVSYTPWPQQGRATVEDGYMQSSVDKVYYNGSYSLMGNWTVWNGNKNPVIFFPDSIAVGALDTFRFLLRHTQGHQVASDQAANNCLLFGDAGTGKSSSIKAIMNEFYSKGLRLIEVYKHQFKDLPKIISQIKSRNYKFIIYMDDLSFEEFEIEYKYLKAVIEGGLETKPDNVLIYATSNRRHLIKESFDDVKDYKPELHSSDTVQEKLSLVARFGVTIYYGAPEKQEYDDIVINLAKKNGIEMDTDELLLEAGRWELNHGGRSGRCAQQFIIYLLGQKALKKQ